MKLTDNKRSRREFIKRAGVTAGAVAISSYTPRIAEASAHRPVVFPELNRRARGWLRFLWDKATTDDDWSSKGQSHQWWDRYTAPGVLSYPRFNAPTVEGVDFPSLGVSQAWNDASSGVLYVTTYPASPDRRGLKTSWRVTGLPNTDNVVVLCDGQPFKQFKVEGPGAIRIDATIDSRRYHIFTGYRGKKQRADDTQNKQGNILKERGRAVAQRTAGGDLETIRRASSDIVSGLGPTCPCCLT